MTSRAASDVLAGVWASTVIEEGQRIEVAYSVRATSPFWSCDVRLTKHGTAPGDLPRLERPTAPDCKY